MCLHLSLAMAGDSLGITGTNGQALLAESAYGKLIVDADADAVSRKTIFSCDKDWLDKTGFVV